MVRNLLSARAMPYPVRHFDPQTIYFVTSRTLQSRFLMAPSRKTNELIGGSLARAVRRQGVELFAYVFTSNHFHLMVRAPTAIAMSRFMQRLQSDIAIKVGRLIDWRGRFFARRYSAEPIVDDGAQVERLGYILSHGVKEGLVSAVRNWPGLSCAQALVEGRTVSQQTWRNWTQRWKVEVGEGLNIGRFSEKCPSDQETLVLTPLPCWAHLAAGQRAQLAAQLVANIDASAPRGRAPRGPRAIVGQDPHGRPVHTKHSARPKAHASTKELWIAAVHNYQVVLAAFREASKKWLRGVFDVEFPPHCFRPPTWGVPVEIV
ncbi:MAG: transposase [Deltaproteobacteria bacterium]|nr:transposase [Deltaproteobacteria bacterium]